MRKELEKILEDEKFVKELLAKETREEAKKAIEDKGVSVTDEEMEEMYQFYSAIYEKCKTMSKEDLDKIAGGVVETAEAAASLWSTGWDFLKNHWGIALNLGGHVINAGIGVRNMVKSSANAKDISELKKQNKQLQNELRDTQNKLLIGGAAAAAGLLITSGLIKNQVRSWIKKSKRK